MPTTVSVRPTTPGDRPDVLALVRAAFAGEAAEGEEEVGIVEAVWSLGPEAVAADLVAVVDGATVGHVLASIGSLEGRAVPGIAPLAVRPDSQHRGVGAALMDDLLGRLAQQGWPLAVLLGSPAYYGRFGFEPSGPLGIHYPPVGPDSRHFQVRRFGEARVPGGGAYAYRWELPPPG